MTAPPPPVYKSASLQQLLQRLSTGAATMKAHFSATFTKAGKSERRAFSGVLAMSGPGRLRMKGSAAMLPTLFDLLSTGKEIILYIPGDKTIYRSGATVSRAGRGIAEAAIITEIFLGAQSPGDIVNFMESSPSRYIVYSVKTENGDAALFRKVIFDRTDLCPVNYQFFERNGAMACDIRCSDFVSPSGPGINVPSRVEIQAPPEENIIALTLSRIRINQPLEEELFRIPTPPGVIVKPLEEYEP